MSLSSEQQRVLFAAARAALEKRLEGGTFREETADPDLLEKRGLFVTLEKRGKLRGCIGTLQPVDTIFASVCDNAQHAAFHDNRFPPVNREELDEIEISISVLTPMEPLGFTDWTELCQKIHPGIDGVLLKKGDSSATFLPQVWEQLPDTEVFFAHLCIKAGLTPEAWKESGTEIFIYQVEYYRQP